MTPTHGTQRGWSRRVVGPVVGLAVGLGILASGAVAVPAVAALRAGEDAGGRATPAAAGPQSRAGAGVGAKAGADATPSPAARVGAVPAATGPAATAAAATPPPGATASTPASDTELVVKLAPGTDVAALNARYGTRTRSVLLASRSIYLLGIPIPAPSSGKSAKDKDWKKRTDGLLQGLDSDPRVVYAELNSDADTTEDDRFHYWPSGGPECTGSDPGRYLQQPAVSQLQLDAVHRTDRGAGATVAVLDTGVDLTHPALRDRIAPGGYDYVDDDRTPAEVRDGTDQDGDGRTDEGYGHGTFVAGIAALVAPDARILPARVLDSDGRGSIFAVAEAIFDATEAGADVINMSFGTSDHVSSHLVTDAIGDAHSSGVIVVGAAGNDGSGAKHYPASVAGVLSVGALAADGVRLAGFSDRGNWVQLAAPGERISSALPCGYGTWSGTSMAAPFVAGAAAVLGGSPVPDAGRRADGNGANDDKGDDDKGDDDKGGDGNNGRHRGQVLRAICEGAVKLHGVQVKAGAIDLRRSLRRIG